MRIAIINLTGGGLSGGYRKYLQNILPLMVKDSRVTDLKVFLPAGNDNLILGSTVAVHSIPSFNPLRKVSWLKSEIAKWQPDVVFIPTARGFECGDIPVITMVHNMEPLVVPFNGNPMRERIINIGRIVIARSACRRAERVIAVSNYVKNYLVEKWNIKEHRIGVVYHGIDSDPHLSGNSERAAASIASPFLFTAGSIRPARGLEDIIKALATLNTEQPVQLAIGGNVDPGMEPYFVKLKEVAEKLGVLERIQWAGKLNDSAMSWYFKNCKAFIMTSRVESFGMIAGEAMAHGCVCISSDNPCLPEIFGSAALYYPPKDFTTLAKQIQVVISMGQAERAAMSSAAKDRASRFSWEICAQKTVAELARAVRNSKLN